MVMDRMGFYTAEEVAEFLGTELVPTGDYTAADVLAKLLTVDGAGSGLDADLLDGQDGVYYLDRANHTGTQAAATISDFAAALAAVGNPLYGRIIAASGAQASHTGNTSETTLATITLPANSLGPNGWVEIEVLWSHTDDASLKTARVKFGGTNYFALSFSTGVSERTLTKVQNRNNAASQVGGPTNRRGLGDLSGVAATTTAVDTTSDVTILITGQLADGTDTVAVEAYSVKAFYKS